MNTFEKLEASGFVNLLEILQRGFNNDDPINGDDVAYADSDTSLLDVWKDISAGGSGLIGNNLATFIVRELMETFDPELESELRGVPACESLTRAIRELQLLQLHLCGSILGKSFDATSFPNLDDLDSFEAYGINGPETKVNEHRRHRSAP